MTSMFQRICGCLLVLVLACGSLSCGGAATNNDQGTSFLALGYYDDADGEVGRTGLILPLFTDQAVYANEFGILSDGLMGWVFLGLQNRLSCQYLRLDRVDCDYDIQGSSLTLPSDSHTFSFVMAPTGPCGDGTQTDALEDNFLYAGIEIIPPDIYTYFNVNQELLPELPFRMTVTCRATGISEAGDVFTTNDVRLLVQFVDNAECCTGDGGAPGFQQGVGTGGTFTSFGDEDEEPDAAAATAAAVSNDDFVIE